MVLHKSLDYGFNGYKVPAMPRASRSIRGRTKNRKKVEDNQMCAFELLATIAGKLLEEEGSLYPASTKKDQPSTIKDIVKQEWQEEVKPMKVESCDQGSCDESVFGCQGNNQNCSSKQLLAARNCAGLGLSSIVAKSNFSEKTNCTDKLVVDKRNNAFRSSPSKEEGSSSVYEETYKGKIKDGIEKQLEVEPWKISSIINGTMPDICSSGDPIELDRKPAALASSDSSVEEPLRRYHIPSGSFSGCQDNVKLFIRDDDENSSGCIQPSTRMNAFRPPSRIGDRRIRKLLTSKYWKVAPKLKDEELSNTDGVMKPIYRNRKTCYTRQRSQRSFPHKRRKLFGQSSLSTSEGGISSEGISNSTEKGGDEDAAGSGARKHGASSLSSLVEDQQASFRSRDCQYRDSCVKLSIKSFRVPEIFIEIPETETVGSLKRTVMEAVTAILGGGLHVGVLLQGKKVKDDNKTLLQTGISHENKLDSLGFMLEPNSSQTPPSLPPENPFLLPCEAPQPLTRYPAAPHLNVGISDASPDIPVINMGNFVESDHDSVPSPDTSNDITSVDSKALVPIPAMSMKALAVIPLHRKSRRSKLVQRRIRRPFSVSEVEALVQAVEELGTGRWRDVKLSAFDNAKHRTYVDLKDKWKTLVHTARISPQQRRGEPVPQELLDRVLAAHAYWSRQQAKQQQVKKQSETFLLSSEF